MSFSVEKWYNEYMNKPSVKYMGEISDDKVSYILDTVEGKLEEWEIKPKAIRKVYNVSVEALQNLYHHAFKPPKEIDNCSKFAGYILEQTGENEFKLITGNFIDLNQKRKLQNRFDQINFLSTDEVRALYKLILNNSEFSFKGGGGLGMIDIARKTKHKLGYKFYEYNEKIFFFEFNVVIS